jgi:two-component system response regulator AtoC
VDEDLSLRVLVVDDEPLIRWSVRQGLRERGHMVTEASCGSDAVALLDVSARQGQDRFDVVVLDYRLPDCRDLTLLDKIHRISPHSAIVMITAYADESVETEAVGRGAFAVLGKPFQVRALVSVVESTVRP